MRVAPSSIASAKSPLIPIDSTSKPNLGCAAAHRPATPASCESMPASHPPPRPTAQSSSARAFQDAPNPAAAPAARPPRPTPAPVRPWSPPDSASPRSAPAAACPASRRLVQTLRQPQRIQRVHPSNNSAARAALFDCKCPIRCTRTGSPNPPQPAQIRSLAAQTPAPGSRQTA
jgi:hypothetical protein